MEPLSLASEAMIAVFSFVVVMRGYGVWLVGVFGVGGNESSSGA